MTRNKKIIAFILAFIAPFVLLKIMGRPIFIETKLTLKAEKQRDKCLPLTLTSLVEENLFIENPSMGFAALISETLQQFDRLDLTFTEFPEGRVTLEPGSPVTTCLKFRSEEKLDELRSTAATLPKNIMLQCKLGVLMSTAEQSFTRVYAIVFPCDRYLANFGRANP